MVASLPFLVTPQLGGVVMGGVVTVGVVMGRGGGDGVVWWQTGCFSTQKTV